MLTDEQEVVLSVVQSGHNAFITGQGGTGKSFLINQIYQHLSRQQKNVTLICSSGIACTVYGPEGKASTVHSHYGLLTAELPWELVVQRALSRNEVKERVEKSDCIIWDEVSMSSARILELVNCIHHHSAAPDKQRNPFGAKQLVLVGEFLQLRPVPNPLDEGKLMYSSNVFSAIPHRYELTKIMRQDDSELDFIDALRDLRTGSCSDDTKQFLVGLSRPLDPDKQDAAVHIYFKRLAVKLHNNEKLAEVPGETITLTAEDDNIPNNFKCPVDDIIRIKPGCKVMHLWNKNDILKNGTTGVVEGVNDSGNIIVNFTGIGTVVVKRETWHSVDRNGFINGSRRQFPLTLAYAITCHKAQGLTLPAVTVHCTKEFVSGLIYVATSRVKSKKNLQVLNFRTSQLLKPPTQSLNICNDHVDPRDNYSCCKDKQMNKIFFQVHDRNDREQDEVVDRDVIIEETSIKDYFERGEADRVHLDLDTVYAVLTDDSPTGDDLRSPPASFNYIALLEELRVDSPKSDFAVQKNAVLDHMAARIEDTTTLIKILWKRICSVLVQENLNVEELKVASKEWTNHMKGVYLYITREKAYLQDLEMYYENHAKLTKFHTTVAAQIMLKLYDKIIDCIARKLHCMELNTPVPFKVKEMPTIGLAKVRHVGAWAVRSVLMRLRKYVNTNMMSTHTLTQLKVRKHYIICEIIEESLIAEFDQINVTTKYKGTLDVTEDRQYRNRGLSHIEDTAFEFFVRIEELRVINLNESKLAHNKDKIVDDAISAVKNDKECALLWDNCFTEELRKFKQDDLKTLFSFIITKYMEAGAGQFLRDFRKAHRMKKSAEHRKKVLQRKQLKQEKEEVIAYQEIANDETPGKRFAHLKLVSFARKFGLKALTSAYQKKELQLICRSYNVKFNTKTTKSKLASDLLLELVKNDKIPNPSCLIKS